MAAFDAPKMASAAARVALHHELRTGGTNYQNFDPFEAADANQSNFRLTSQDDDELEVTIPVAEDVGKKDVAVRFTARSLRVTVKGETLIDSPLKGRIYPDECSWSFGTASGTRALILSLGKRDTEMWSKLLARTPPAPDAKDGPQFVQWPYLDPKFGEGKGRLLGVAGRPMMRRGELTMPQQMDRSASTRPDASLSARPTRRGAASSTRWRPT